MKNRRKAVRKQGISPVIASIILIAVTIAIAIAVAGFVFGLFGTYTAAGGVSYVGSPTVSASSGNLLITLKNDGSNTKTVSAITVVVTGTLRTGTLTGTPAIAGGGGTQLLTAAYGTAVFTAGQAYNFKISFTDGSTLTVTIVGS